MLLRGYSQLKSSGVVAIAGDQRTMWNRALNLGMIPVH